MADDISGPVGPVEYSVLRQLRELFLNDEPLVDTATLDDPANPTHLVVEFTSGLESPGRFEITWGASGAYRFHYTEQDGLDFRFDRHPKADAPTAHFHPPSDADRVEPSFLAGVTQPQVVTRAVLARWREAIVWDGDLGVLNPINEG